MRKFGWIAVPLCMLGFGCAHQEAFDDAQREIASQDEVIRELKGRNEGLMAERDGLRTDLKEARAQVSALKAGREGIDQDLLTMKKALSEFEAKFGRWDAELGITMKPVAGGFALEVAETVLFAPGRANLTKQGRDLLGKVASRIREHDGDIRVEGHTDNQPVVVRAKEYPLGNLQLSGRRALVVADYLVAQGGIPAGKVSFAGYGEHHPLVSNATAEDRARNRRVEIVLLSPPTNGK